MFYIRLNFSGFVRNSETSSDLKQPFTLKPPNPVKKVLGLLTNPGKYESEKNLDTLNPES